MLHLITAASFLICLNSKQYMEAVDVYRIGTVFKMESMQYQNLKYAVDRWNMQNEDGKFTLEIAAASAYLDIIDRVCSVLKQNVIAFVLSSTMNSSDAQSTIAMCHHFHVPCIILNGNFLYPYENEYTLNIGPSQEWISSAIDELITDLHWTSFLLLYQSRKDLISLNGLISQLPRTSHGFVSMKVRQLPEDDNDYVPFLKSVQKTRELNIILHSDKLSVMFQFLQRAKSLNMTNHRYSYIFTNMDLFLVEEYISAANNAFECNISGFRIVQTHPLMKTEVALTSDAVSVVGKTILNLKNDGRKVTPRSIICGTNSSWSSGTVINQALKQAKMKSLATGGIEFNEAGQRSLLVVDGIRRINGQFVKANH